MALFFINKYSLAANTCFKTRFYIELVVDYFFW